MDNSAPFPGVTVSRSISSNLTPQIWPQSRKLAAISLAQTRVGFVSTPLVVS